METERETMYTVTVQTPAGAFRGKMRLQMDERSASGMLYWESYTVPFAHVPVRNEEAAFHGSLKNPPLNFTVKISEKRRGKSSSGNLAYPFRAAFLSMAKKTEDRSWK